MKITSIHFLKVCLASYLLTSFIGLANADDPSNIKGSDTMSRTMHDGMKEMESMKMSGDVDKDFAMMMKMHHQQALVMAQLEIDQGKSSEMKAMAKKIITGQKKEISKFDAWLSKQK